MEKLRNKHKNKNKSSSKRWFPLESNPSLLNKYISKLGLDTSLYSFVDVFSTEDWALAMIPQPVAAVLMLYPITPVQEQHRHTEQEQLNVNNNNHHHNDNDNDDNDDDDTNGVWYTKQRIGNACGTIGILHSLANLSPPHLKETTFGPKSWISRFLEACPTTLSSEQKANVLEGQEDDNDNNNNDDYDKHHPSSSKKPKMSLSMDLANELEHMHDHATSDSSNQTNRGNLDDDINTHFVALVHVNSKLYELDGRKSQPICHGNTNVHDLLKDACRVVKQFMDRDPNEMRFTILALAPTPSDYD